MAKSGHLVTFGHLIGRSGIMLIGKLWGVAETCQRLPGDHSKIISVVTPKCSRKFK